MLSKNWILEGCQDFEYKQYILLGYLKTIESSFNRNELYPPLADILAQFQNLKHIKENNELLKDDFPKTIKRIDFDNLRLEYNRLNTNEPAINHLFEVIDYALPKMKSVLEDGMQRYDYVENCISVEPIGLVPLYKKEGYLLLDCDGQKTFVYRYTISDLKTVDECFVSINTELIETENRSISNHHQQMKLKLIKRFKDLPNPATYAVISQQNFPVKQTLLPITERILLRQLAA